MTYAELTARINELSEYTFTAAQLALFVQQAEQFIYNTVQIPALQTSSDGNLTAGNPYLTMPEGFLWPKSLAVIKDNGEYTFLLNKDYNFMREAYPNPNSTGLPKFYAIFDQNSFIISPTPNANFVVQLTYGKYPESIVTAGQTWLGEEFDSALLNASMIEAARFNKLEPDVIQMYNALLERSLVTLKNLGDGKMRQDTYRSGQFKMPVT